MAVFAHFRSRSRKPRKPLEPADLNIAHAHDDDDDESDDKTVADAAGDAGGSGGSGGHGATLAADDDHEQLPSGSDDDAMDTLPDDGQDGREEGKEGGGGNSSISVHDSIEDTSFLTPEAGRHLASPLPLLSPLPYQSKSPLSPSPLFSSLGLSPNTSNTRTKRARPDDEAESDPEVMSIKTQAQARHANKRMRPEVSMSPDIKAATYTPTLGQDGCYDGLHDGLHDGQHDEQHDEQNCKQHQHHHHVPSVSESGPATARYSPPSTGPGRHVSPLQEGRESNDNGDGEVTVFIPRNDVAASNASNNSDSKGKNNNIIINNEIDHQQQHSRLEDPLPQSPRPQPSEFFTLVPAEQDALMDPDGWLNDNVVNRFVFAAAAYSRDSSMLALSSTALGRPTGSPSALHARTLADCGLNPRYTSLVFPVFLDSHWTCAIVVTGAHRQDEASGGGGGSSNGARSIGPAARITLVDSLAQACHASLNTKNNHRNRPGVIQLVSEFMEMLVDAAAANLKQKQQAWQCGGDPVWEEAWPQQDNTSDCGIHTVAAAFHYAVLGVGADPPSSIPARAWRAVLLAVVSRKPLMELLKSPEVRSLSVLYSHVLTLEN